MNFRLYKCSSPSAMVLKAWHVLPPPPPPPSLTLSNVCVCLHAYPSPPTVSKLYKSSGVQSIQTLKTQNMGQHRYFASPFFLPFFFFLPPPFFLRGCGGLGVSQGLLFHILINTKYCQREWNFWSFQFCDKNNNPASYSFSLSLNPQIKKKKRKERKGTWNKKLS